MLDELRPAAVVNAAYVPRDPGLTEITRDAPIAIAEWTAPRATRFVQLSTDIVFDGELGRPYTEADQPNPVNDYGRAKAAMEAAVAAADPASVLVRTSLLWGGSGDGGPQVRLVQSPASRPRSTRTARSSATWWRSSPRRTGTSAPAF